MQLWEQILRIILAAAGGFAVGLERTNRSKEAGIRTHCIIASASALFMILSLYGFRELSGPEGALTVGGVGTADPARVAAGIVSGVSFLGAGVIYRTAGKVKGLTTAAGIWATAALGMSFGCGMYLVGIFMTVFLVVIQTLMHRHSIGADAWNNSEIRITFQDSPEIRSTLKAEAERFGIQVIGSRILREESGTVDLSLNVRMRDSIPFEESLRLMREHPEIRRLDT